MSYKEFLRICMNYSEKWGFVGHSGAYRARGASWGSVWTSKGRFGLRKGAGQGRASWPTGELAGIRASQHTSQPASKL